MDSLVDVVDGCLGVVVGPFVGVVVMNDAILLLLKYFDDILYCPLGVGNIEPPLNLSISLALLSLVF